MSTYNITLEDASKEHPDLVKKIQDEAAKKLKKSKAKNKGKDITELSWCYTTCVSISNSGSLQDLLNGKLKRTNYSKMSLEKKIEDEISRTSAGLSASMNGAYAGVTLSDVPHLVKEHIRAAHIKEEQEQQRVNSLSPQQKEEEFRSILGQLSKNKGFVAF